ncbi:hypothetical protein GOODEAATRI_027918 [Goodea atripinnis]|uniref:Uncharacterized protein n=1 Tax=Goodea atripinnis TaxID=208336 RepID=A0ABV0PS93_9TELE
MIFPLINQMNSILYNYCISSVSGELYVVILCFYLLVNRFSSLLAGISKILKVKNQRTHLPLPEAVCHSQHPIITSTTGLTQAQQSTILSYKQPYSQSATKFGQNPSLLPQTAVLTDIRVYISKEVDSDHIFPNHSSSSKVYTHIMLFNKLPSHAAAVVAPVSNTSIRQISQMIGSTENTSQRELNFR